MQSVDALEGLGVSLLCQSDCYCFGEFASLSWSRSDHRSRRDASVKVGCANPSLPELFSTLIRVFVEAYVVREAGDRRKYVGAGRLRGSWNTMRQERFWIPGTAGAIPGTKEQQPGSELF